MSQKTAQQPEKSDFFTATNNGSRGCRWHIFKKTGEYNDTQESLCGRYNTDRIRRNASQKPLENLDLDSPPGLGSWCTKCLQAVRKHLEED
jgi:bacterioferritin-associated ferredoxin